MQVNTEKSMFKVKSNPEPEVNERGEQFSAQSVWRTFTLQSRVVGAVPLTAQFGQADTHVVLFR